LANPPAPVPHPFAVTTTTTILKPVLVLCCINNRYMRRRVRARGLQEICRPRALTRRYR
jgi:hypothetical protein